MTSLRRPAWPDAAWPDAAWPADERRGRDFQPLGDQRALTRFLLVGLGSLLIIAIPTVLAYDIIAKDFALTLAAQSGRNLARRVLAPTTTTQAIAGDKLALARIDATVRAGILAGSVAGSRSIT